MDNGGSNATIVKTNASTTTGRSTDSINVDLILASNLLVSNTVGGNGFALNLSGTITESGGSRSVTVVGGPTALLEEPETQRIRELAQLAQLVEKNLITADEFKRAKAAILNPPHRPGYGSARLEN